MKIKPWGFAPNPTGGKPPDPKTVRSLNLPQFWGQGALPWLHGRAAPQVRPAPCGGLGATPPRFGFYIGEALVKQRKKYYNTSAFCRDRRGANRFKVQKNCVWLGREQIFSCFKLEIV